MDGRMKVYILSISDEDGPEVVHASLDKTKLPEIIFRFGLEVTEDEMFKLKTLIEKDEITNERGTCLAKGWGGFQLHIVELE
jgi:hypothetical protein